MSFIHSIKKLEKILTDTYPVSSEIILYTIELEEPIIPTLMKKYLTLTGLPYLSLFPNKERSLFSMNVF